MKNTLIYLGIFLALLALSVFLIFNNQEPNEEEQRSFQTPKIQELTKVKLKDRQGNVTLLSLKDGDWLINEKFLVNKVTLNDLFYALEHMESAYPAPSVAIDNVLTQMIGNSTKVSLYKNGKEQPFKVFNVGGPNHEQNGCYMIMEVNGKPADPPYVVKLPGFSGYITYRFSAIQNFWIGTQFTKLLAEEIKSISLSFFQEDKDQSFVLDQDRSGYFMQQGEQRFNQESLNMDMLDGLYSAFMDLSFERYIDSIPMQDSVMKNMHYADLKLQLTEGQERKISLYFKPYPEQENLPLDENGNPLTIDASKLYAFDHASQSFFTAQYFTFGKLFVKANQFKK
jgi:hypothetical protein